MSSFPSNDLMCVCSIDPLTLAVQAKLDKTSSLPLHPFLLHLLLLFSEPELSGVSGAEEEFCSPLPATGPALHPAAVPGHGPAAQGDDPQSREPCQAHADAGSSR